MLERGRKHKKGYLLEMFREWKWMVHYFCQYKWEIFFYIGAGIFSTILSLASAVASKYLIDAVTGFQADRILSCAAATVGLAFGSMLISAGIGRGKYSISTRVHRNLQGDVFKHMTRARWLELNRYRNGDLLNRLDNDTIALTGNVLNFIPMVINNGVAFAGALGIMVYYDPVMALLALISAPLTAGLGYKVMGKIREYSKGMLKAGSEKTAFAEDAISNIQTIKAFGIHEYFEKRMGEKLEHYREIAMKNNRFSVYCNILLSGIGILVTYGCYGWGVYRLWSGFITYGTMTLFIDLAGRVREGFSNLITLVPGMISTASHAARIMELEDIPGECVWAADSASCVGTGCTGIRLEEITFAYEEGKPVLDKVSFTAEPGEITAFIGPSGEGKTTLIRLLLGLVKPQEGQALFRDSAGKEIPLGEWQRRLFSYVPQGNTLFAGSIAENLRMVKENASEEEIMEALKAADAWGFVKELRGGIHYELGEHGKGLSEGQAQRISIARALVRNSPVLLLDEATSALDPWTEQRVLKQIVKKNRDKILIVTAHRQSVVEMSDRIYRVNKGKLERVRKFIPLNG